MLGRKHPANPNPNPKPKPNPNPNPNPNPKQVKLPPADPRPAFLWAALEAFTREERGLFLQFVWGRSRMPQGGGRLSQRFVISDLGRQEGDPDTRLPTASTCFFDLHLPRYTSGEVP